MTTYPIEVGTGDVWTFVASANTTSGLVLYMDGAKVRPTTAVSQHVIGVSLIPASVGDFCSVIMHGVVDIKITGAAVVAGDLLGPAEDGYARERAWAQTNMRNYDLAVALETISNGSHGKVRLLI